MSREFNQPSIDEILAILKRDDAARAAVAKTLAKEFPKEYLAHVAIDAESLKSFSARFMSSAKEWQE